MIVTVKSFYSDDGMSLDGIYTIIPPNHITDYKKEIELAHSFLDSLSIYNSREELLEDYPQFEKFDYNKGVTFSDTDGCCLRRTLKFLG